MGVGSGEWGMKSGVSPINYELRITNYELFKWVIRKLARPATIDIAVLLALSYIKHLQH